MGFGKRPASGMVLVAQNMVINTIQAGLKFRKTLLSIIGDLYVTRVQWSETRRFH